MIKYTCDWCPTPASWKMELKKKKKSGWIGTAQFWYSCNDTHHKDLLKEMAEKNHSDLIGVSSL